MEDDHSAVEVKEEIDYHFHMKADLKAKLPKSINFGPFHVNVWPLKEYLINKRKHVAIELLKTFTIRLRNQLNKNLIEYADIIKKLKDEPQNIEQVFEIREWMETIPLTVKSLDENVQRLKLEYDILDYFSWNLSDEDFIAKWQAIGFPQKIEKQVSYNDFIQ